MHSYFVYMVIYRDRTFYTGVTRDAEYRVAQHDYGVDAGCYTYARRPVRLVSSQQFKEIDDAIRVEKQIKGWSRKKKAALIRGDWETIAQVAREIRRPKITSRG